MVRVVAVHTVRPTHDALPPLRLSALDHFYNASRRAPISGVWLFTAAPIDAADALRDSLARFLAVRAHTWLAGRLQCAVTGLDVVLDGSGGSGGVRFVEAECDPDEADLRHDRDIASQPHGVTVSTAGSRLAPPLDTGALLAVQVTRVTGLDRCVALGVSASHAAVDGCAFFALVRAWAAVHRGDAAESEWLQPDRAPLLRLLRDVDPPEGATCASWTIGAQIADTEAVNDRKTIVAVHWFFTRTQLDALKGDHAVSTGSALAAHVWRELVRFRCRHGGDGDATLCVPVNLRGRLLGAEQCKRFTGNFVGSARVVRPLAQLLHEPLGDTAAAVDAAVRVMDARAQLRELAWMQRVERDDPDGFDRVHWRHGWARTDLVLTNTSSFDAYAVGFEPALGRLARFLPGQPLLHDGAPPRIVNGSRDVRRGDLLVSVPMPEDEAAAFRAWIATGHA